MSLGSRDQRVIWHPYTEMKSAPPPIPIVRGEGAYLIDDAGNRYLDATSSWWVNLHGHANPYIAERVAAQLRRLEHVMFAGCTHEGAVELAERLLALLPGEQARIFYSDDGSTAVEVALKMALQYWWLRGEPRRRFVAFEGAYHGDTLGAMSVSARGPFSAPFDGNLFDCTFIPLPRASGEPHEAGAALRAAIARGGVAAFIFEPLVQGVAGFRTYPAEALDALLAICREAGVLAIADEVMTGFARTGRNFACEHLAEKPDMICLSKGLTGGTMALGATSVNRRVVDAFLTGDRRRAFFHGHSYTANPVACAAALASLDLLLAADCRRRIGECAAAQGAYRARVAGHPALGDARHLGTILALDLAGGEERGGYFDPRGPDLAGFFRERGVLVRPLGSVLYILPPYCITLEELHRIHSVVDEALDRFGASHRRDPSA